LKSRKTKIQSECEDPSRLFDEENRSRKQEKKMSTKKKKFDGGRRQPSASTGLEAASLRKGKEHASVSGFEVAFLPQSRAEVLYSPRGQR
jgi:hypothetical protein